MERLGHPILQGVAQELAMEPVGYQLNFEDEEVAWIGEPFTEEGKKEAGQSN